MLQSYIQILQLQTSPDQFLMFLIKLNNVLLLLITSGVLFQSMLPLNDTEFMPIEFVPAALQGVPLLAKARPIADTCDWRKQGHAATKLCANSRMITSPNEMAPSPQ